MWILNCLFENAQGKIYFILPLRHQESIHHSNSCLTAFRHRTWFCSPGLARTPNTGNLFGIKRAAESGIFQVSPPQNKQLINAQTQSSSTDFFLTLPIYLMLYRYSWKDPGSLFVCRCMQTLHMCTKEKDVYKAHTRRPANVLSYCSAPQKWRIKGASGL